MSKASTPCDANGKSSVRLYFILFWDVPCKTGKTRLGRVSKTCD